MPEFDINPYAKGTEIIGSATGEKMDHKIARLQAKIIEDNRKAGKQDPYVVCCEQRRRPGVFCWLNIGPAYAGWHNNLKLIIEGRLRICSPDEEAEAKAAEDARTSEACDAKNAVKFEKGVQFLGQMVGHAQTNTEKRGKK